MIVLPTSFYCLVPAVVLLGTHVRPNFGHPASLASQTSPFSAPHNAYPSTTADTRQDHEAVSALPVLDCAVIAYESDHRAITNQERSIYG